MLTRFSEVIREIELEEKGTAENWRRLGPGRFNELSSTAYRGDHAQTVVQGDHVADPPVTPTQVFPPLPQLIQPIRVGQSGGSVTARLRALEVKVNELIAAIEVISAQVGDE
jgi:hypothetical protein